MPDARGLPLFRWGEELRRLRLLRRALRLRTFAAIGATLLAAALLATLFRPSRPLLLWNASPSSPVGLYAVTAATDIRPGEKAVVWPPPRARRLASERRYLPANVPLVKQVAATGGDRVCAAGEAIFVNGDVRALRRRTDAVGRPLPWWNGCTTLGEDQLLLLAPAEASFDGRYFGVSERSDLVGEARLLWAR